VLSKSKTDAEFRGFLCGMGVCYELPGHDQRPAGDPFVPCDSWKTGMEVRMMTRTCDVADHRRRLSQGSRRWMLARGERRDSMKTLTWERLLRNAGGSLRWPSGGFEFDGNQSLFSYPDPHSRTDEEGQ